MDRSSESVLVSKVPMLKPNEFDMWKIRIRQYILLTDYSMWYIIENSPSSEGEIGAYGKRPPPKTDGERKMRFNKLIGELATVGVKMDQDDVNRKFLRSLGEEWVMYIVSFRQNDNLEEKDLDDPYNDLRVFEAEVESKKKPSGYSHNAALLSSTTDSTANAESVSAAYGSKQDGLSHSVLEAYHASHAKTSLINDDLEQINVDNLEEMDIKWQMAMLTMRIKRFIKRTGRNNFSMRREDGVGFDKSKVECYKCHKLGHFARECRGGMSQQNGNNNKNSSQALVSQDGMGFDWSEQADEAIQNQALMAEVSESSSTAIPTEVKSKLCSQACLETVKKYRDHNQSMCDDLKRLEQHRRESNLIIVNFEEQIKAYQDNELQHSYDQNYWKWEKKELEIKLEKVREECEKIRSEFEKAKLDIEKFSNASKAMDSLLKSQVHDKLKRGIGYNNTPPPYNNNYIPPTSDLLERQEKKDLPVGATEVDPLDTVVVEAESEEQNNEDKNKEDQKEIPLENHILTNERGVSTVNNVSTADQVCTANEDSTANKVSVADQVNIANKDSTAISVNTDRPKIKTKYSSHEIPDSDHLIKTKLNEYEYGNQQLKGKSIWYVDSGFSRHTTANMSCLQNFKMFDGGRVAFGDNPAGGKISGKVMVSKGNMTFEDVCYVEQLRYNLLSVSQVFLGIFSED
ncbi:hypothetical protein L6452_42391 [Arctium lappa]|uniref:Uncharacterized protein n=1 Tax=Arctium lappa TaxID=4217 RepID=A0ACB8XJB9_ARCLA|nr:hypothetical protein L6452_42391 [Arctium lappa]